MDMNFKETVTAFTPLQIVGTINAYHAIMAKKVGFKAIYLSGAGVANSSIGVPDLGITNLQDILTDVVRITDACDLPLLVDIDTGFGGAYNIARTIKSLIKFGAAACHIEDQISNKRCGHRPNKVLVSSSEMEDRIKSAVDARFNHDFVVMARTDAIASEGIEKAIQRMLNYVKVGADMIFAEAVTDLNTFKLIKQYIKVPVLANITEFGVTPLFTLDELKQVGIDIALYPLSAFRSMNAAALNVYHSIFSDGTQKNVIHTMQTRSELYNFLDYISYEKKLDLLFTKKE